MSSVVVQRPIGTGPSRVIYDDVPALDPADLAWLAGPKTWSREAAERLAHQARLAADLVTERRVIPLIVNRARNDPTLPDFMVVCTGPQLRPHGLGLGLPRTVAALNVFALGTAMAKGRGGLEHPTLPDNEEGARLVVDGLIETLTSADCLSSLGGVERIVEWRHGQSADASSGRELAAELSRTTDVVARYREWGIDPASDQSLRREFVAIADRIFILATAWLAYGLAVFDVLRLAFGDQRARRVPVEELDPLARWVAAEILTEALRRWVPDQRNELTALEAASRVAPSEQTAEAITDGLRHDSFTEALTTISGVLRAKPLAPAMIDQLTAMLAPMPPAVSEQVGSSKSARWRLFGRRAT